MFFKNFSLFTFPFFIKGLLAVFILIPLVTFYLGPKELGIYALITEITLLLQPISHLGSDWKCGNACS